MQVLLVAGLGVLVVLLAILLVRLHPFVALLLGTLLVLALTPESSWLRSQLSRDFLVIQDLVPDDRVALRVDRPQELVAPGRYLLWRMHSDQPEPDVWQLSAVEPSGGILHLAPVPKDSPPKGAQDQAAPNAAYSSERSDPRNDDLSTSDLCWLRVQADPAQKMPAVFQGRVGDRLIAVNSFYAAQSRATSDRIDGMIERLSLGLSGTFQKIGLSIAMAALIGVCLLESGAAHSVIQWMSARFGPQRTSPVLMLSGFLLGIPIFFDTVFYLLLPLAKAFGRSRPGQGLLAIMSVIVGATMAHSLVPPTPGPLLVASQLNVSVGAMMLGGLAVGAIATTVGYLYSLWCNHRWGWQLEVVPEDAAEPADSPIETTQNVHRLARIPIGLAILPLAFPIVCLGGAELLPYLGITEYFTSNFHRSGTTGWVGWMGLLGQPGFVLMISAAMAYGLLRRVVSAGQSLTMTSRAIADAGVIILLTCAGGAFGAALQQLGLAEAITAYSSQSISPPGLLVMAFTMTALIRVAQGSATVAMITSVAIVSPMVQSQSLPYHPVYVALAIGCGSKLLPWMNDSGFWQVSTMTGMSVQQTLRTFSVALTLMGCAGFITVLLAAYFLPFRAT